MAGSRLGFERNQVQLHQVLAVKLDDDGVRRRSAAAAVVERLIKPWPMSA